MVSKIRRTYALILFVAVLPFLAGAQGDPLLRVEIDTKSDEARFRVVPCGDAGAAMFYKTTVAEDMYTFWIFILYNKILNESWKKDIPLFDNMSYADHVIQGNYLYCFFFDAEKKKSEEYNFQLLKLRLDEGSYELFSGLLPLDSKFLDFKVFGDQVVVGLSLEEKHAGIFTFNLNSRDIKAQVEMTGRPSRVESIYIDEENQRCMAVLNVYETKTSYYLLLYEFGLDGQELGTLQIIPEPGKKFNSGKVAMLSGDARILFGTYGVVNGASIDDKDYFVREAAGFYTMNITDPDNIVLRHQNFLDLENMTGYLKSKEYMTAKKKAERKDEDDKEKFSVNYDMLLHDVVERDSLFYFVGEAYYEHYHTVTNTYYDYYGRAVPVSYSVFDGYRYFNAFISCYDHNGNKLWDNGMEIFNILTFDLFKRVVVFFSGDEVVMAYNREGKISAKIIDGPRVIDGVDNFPLETTYINDKVIEDTRSNMVHWYDNYFLAYGFQTIRNNALGDRSKRTVFYINKVGFQ